MKERIIEGIILLFAIATVTCLIIGTIYKTKQTTDNAEPAIEAVQIEYSDFNLVVDGKTGIVYIDNAFKTSYNSVIHDNHIYTPYYSENGKLCRFDDNQLIEIGN